MASNTEKQGFFQRLQTSPRLQRRIFIVSLGVFAIGAVAATATLLHQTTSTPTTPADTQGPSQVIASQKKVPLSAEARAVAVKWILGAVARQDLEGTYDLTHPDLRGTMSRAEWASGTIPVGQYPTDEVDQRFWKVHYSHPTEALVELELFPAKKGEIRPYKFYIGLRKIGTGADAHWVVDYWAPNYKPPVRYPQ